MPVEELALEVGGVDDVEVDDAEPPDTGGGQIHGGGRSEAPGPEEEDARVKELALAGATDLGEDEVTGVPGDLIWGETPGGGHRASQYTQGALAVIPIV
ncbi:MAG: hypothetical protein NVS1B3_03220 [Candidatus Dormibacteraceae bacterium]